MFSFLCVSDFNNLTEEQKIERHEKELETIIDPFSVPFPWVRKTKLSGEVMYVNMETQEEKSKKPSEVSIQNN